MSKVLPTLLVPLFVLFLLPSDIFGASLEVSKNSGFMSTDKNFNVGDTVFVRIKTDLMGSSHILYVKDNNYSTISSVNLSQSEDGYTASFSAPDKNGYYSLEARIEGEGSSVVGVRTINVGGLKNGGSVKVNVNNSVRGMKLPDDLKDSDKLDIPEGSRGLTISESSAEEGLEQLESFSDVGLYTNRATENDKGFFGMVFDVFWGIWNIIKFF